MSDDNGPPTNSGTSKSMTGTYPKYAETPMPFDEEEDETDQSLYEELEQPSGQSLLSTAVKVLVIAIISAHLFAVWTLKADINFVLAHQKEQVQQYTHIISLLQNMKQVQWQIVPA